MYGIQVLIEKDGRLRWHNAKAFGASTFYQYGTREDAEEASREISIHRERVRVVPLLRTSASDAAPALERAALSRPSEPHTLLPVHSSRGPTSPLTTTPPIRGRRAKFTPQVIEKIKDFVAQGISRNEIANRLGVTVGSLQVTCSRLGISLRIISANGSRRHTADIRGKTIPTPWSVGITHMRGQKEASPVAKFAITIRHRGREQTTDIPLSSAVIEVLALEAMSRDLAISELIGQILVAAINKDMIQKILCGEVPSS